MIFVGKHEVTLEGSLHVLLSDTAMVLAGIYRELVRAVGEEEAGKILATTGKAAVSGNTQSKMEQSIAIERVEPLFK